MVWGLECDGSVRGSSALSGCPLPPTMGPPSPRAGRAGVPLEVMGLMLGEFIDDYTVQCVDVFAMPQSGTSVSVESVDPVFQQQMLEMLKQTGRWAWGLGPCVGRAWVV